MSRGATGPTRLLPLFDSSPYEPPRVPYPVASGGAFGPPLMSPTGMAQQMAETPSAPTQEDTSFELRIDPRAKGICVGCGNPNDHVIDAHLSGPNLLNYELLLLPCPYCTGQNPDAPDEPSPESGVHPRIVRTDDD
jgi:hypothetical protein